MSAYCLSFISASSLPGEDGEYYQFVYFDSKNHMRGASSPFNFKSPANFDDLVEEEMDEDNDMLFITTRQTQLEKQISELTTEKDVVEQVSIVNSNMAAAIFFIRLQTCYFYSGCYGLDICQFAKLSR